MSPSARLGHKSRAQEKIGASQCEHCMGMHPSIVLDGSKAGKSVSGLVLWETASASEVKGLRIQKFDRDGIQIKDVGNCTIGGTTAAESCILVNNKGAGVHITGKAAMANYVIYCYIGNDGTKKLGNDEGVRIDGRASSNNIGDGNLEHR